MKNVIVFMLTACLMVAFSTFGNGSGVAKKPLLKSYKIEKVSAFELVNNGYATVEEVSLGVEFVSLAVLSKSTFRLSNKAPKHNPDKINLERLCRYKKSIHKNLNAVAYIQRGQRPISV